MTIHPHIEFAALIDFAEGRLGVEEQGQVATHLSVCERCSAQAAEVRDVINLMSTDVAEDAPRHARSAAARLFQARAKTSESPLRRVLAALKFDSLQPGFAMGLRAGAAAERQLLFEAGDNELQLQIAAASGGWQITGQVLGPCADGSIELEGDQGSARASLNELCEFVLPPQPDGVYSLTLHLANTELAIPELKLGDPKA